MDFHGAPRSSPQRWYAGYVPPARGSKSLRSNRRGEATFYVHSGRASSESGQIRMYTRQDGLLRVEVQAEQRWLDHFGVEGRLLQNLTDESAKDVFMNRFRWAMLDTPLVLRDRLADRLRDYRDENGRKLQGATRLAVLGYALSVQECLGDLGASDPTIRGYVQVLKECGWMLDGGAVSQPCELQLDPASGLVVTPEPSATSREGK